MLKLISTTTYDCDGLTITVTGLTCTELTALLPICNAMTRKINDRILEISKDSELSGIIQKRSEGIELSPEEKIRMFSFNNASEDFSLEEAHTLVEHYLDNIIRVMQGDEDVTDEFKHNVFDSPKHLKSLANLIFTEYKEATEVSPLKKV